MALGLLAVLLSDNYPPLAHPVLGGFLPYMLAAMGVALAASDFWKGK